MPTCTIGNTVRHYEDYVPKTQTGDVYLILHGWGGSAQSRTIFSQILQARGHRVIVPDLPGFGQTTLSHSYTLTDYAQELTELVIHLALENYILLWHSNGWRISIASITLGLLSPTQLILVNSAGVPRPLCTKARLVQSFSGIGKSLFRHTALAWLRKLVLRFVGGHDRAALENPLLKKTFINVVHEDLREDMTKISLPTHVIRGEKDTYTPLRQGRAINRLIDGSKFTVMEGQKHGIHLHAPDLLADVVLK